MSPHRTISISSRRHPTQIQDIFVGLAFNLAPETTGSEGRDLEYTAVLHDGTGVTESETYHLTVYTAGKDAEGKTAEARRVSLDVLEKIGRLQKEKAMNVRMIAIAQPVPVEIRGKDSVEFLPKVWLHVDAIPFVTTPATSMFTRLPAPSTQASASSAVAAGIKHLHPATHSATTADVAEHDHHVQVDCDGQVKLCSILQYEQSTSPELWKRFLALSSHLREKDITISFFSATPQGGGVALMRHALIRLWKMVGLDVKWYVPEGHPAVFDITKRKIHNVLQGVAPKGVELTDEDKRWFEIWTEQNYESFWAKGALDASLIVIDDPQLTALIPIIRKKRPDAKIIFRSHIQIQSDLTDDPSTPQHRVWNYLFNFVKDVDLFLAHPVKFFVPKNVLEHLPVLYMAPSTDPLDGLNKPYGKASVAYFRQYFNSLSAKQCGVTIDWERGYICQIARFDPSKGIEDLLAAYLMFRQSLERLEPPPLDNGPQLIIMGHGSVDDPDGSVIYERLHDMLSKPNYELVREDVSIVRAPPSDSILGCILQGSWVATQLSTREGFEVKVTEAINKRVPIIASDAGGIPLQVKDGINGWVVPTSNPAATASVLLDIYTGKKSVKRGLSSDRRLDTSASQAIDEDLIEDANKDIIQGDGTSPNAVAEQFVKHFDKPMIKVHADSGATSEDFWTVGNSVRWMLLASRLLGLPAEFETKGLGEEEGVLKSMEVGKALNGKGVEGGNVWKMVMGDDIGEGEGELRVDGH